MFTWIGSFFKSQVRRGEPQRAKKLVSGVIQVIGSLEPSCPKFFRLQYAIFSCKRKKAGTAEFKAR